MSEPIEQITGLLIGAFVAEMKARCVYDLKVDIVNNALFMAGKVHNGQLYSCFIPQEEIPYIRNPQEKVSQSLRLV